MTPRRFPPPWTIENIGAAFVVEKRSHQNKLLTRDEAQRIAVNIAKLPEVS